MGGTVKIVHASSEEEQEGEGEGRKTLWDQSKPIDSERDRTYFGYYGMLTHQQNMLLDAVRTSAYLSAITGNTTDFAGKVVLDVGAGTGILSFFAAKAGARKVYAVEASDMARHAARLAKSNDLQGIIQVIRGKIEDIHLPEPVDVIISEPMGVLLVHERMMETFILARDRFLKASGPSSTIEPRQLFPSSGFIHLAPFCDITLYADAISKIAFWNNRDFYGVDLRVVTGSAAKGYFSQPVIGPVDPKSLLATPVMHAFRFDSMAITDFCSFSIPLSFAVHTTGIVHGLAGWFDVLFSGSQNLVQLSTSPTSERTHWHQIRLLLPRPLALNMGQTLLGTVNFTANNHRSYDIYVRLTISGSDLVVEQSYALQDQQYWNLNGAPNVDIQRELFGLYSDLF